MIDLMTTRETLFDLWVEIDEAPLPDRVDRDEWGLIRDYAFEIAVTAFKKLNAAAREGALS